jgi:hypothetical protein
MRLYELNLKGGEPSLVSVTGDYFRVLTSAERFQVRFNGPGIVTDTLAGLGLHIPRFDSLELTSNIDQTVTIMAGFGSVDDSRLAGQVDLSGALQMITTAAQTVNQGTLTVTDTATLVAAANVDRRSLLVQVSATAEANVYYGTDNTVTTATGIRVAPGGALTVENAADFYLITGAGLTADVVYLEEVN